MKKLFKNRTIRFVVVLIFINLAYFYVYYKSLAAELSVISFLYTLILTLSFITLILFLSAKRWLIPVFIFYLLFLIYSLTNFGYFQVFNNFFVLETLWLSKANAPLSMFLDFYALIPIQVYLAALLTFFIFVYASLKYTRPKRQHLLFCSEILKNSKIKLTSAFVMLLLFTVINASGIGLVNFFEKNPQEEWWNLQKYALDNGVAGYVYKQINSSFLNSFELVYAGDSKALGNGEIMSTEANLPTVFDKIRDDIKNLDSREPTDSEEITEPEFILPTFTAPPNILIYQMESVDSWGMVGEPSPMPFLKQLMADNISVAKFFPNSCQTINAEFSTLCSFLPESHKPISDTSSDNDYYCLPSILKDKYQYHTAFFHANNPDFWNREVLVPKWGFDELFFVPYFPRVKYDDGKVIAEAVKHLAESKEPVFSYVVGFTSHSLHTFDEMQWNKRDNGINISLYKGQLDPEIVENSDLATEIDVRAYLGFMEEIDRDIKILFDSLKKAGELENTIVVIFADHRYYNFSKPTLANFYYYNEIPFVMYVPGMGQSQTQKVASHVDIAPTLLQILEGDNYKELETFIGTSLFSSDHPNNAVQKCLSEIQYIDPKTVVQGNAETGVYRVLYSDKVFLSGESNDLIQKIKSLAETTDNILLNNKLVDK